MQYQDELEATQAEPAAAAENCDSDTDWSRLARQAASEEGAGRAGGGRRGGGPRRGGVRKK